MNGLKDAAAIVAAAVMPTALAVFGVVGTMPAHAEDHALLGICDFPISHEFPKLHGNRGHELPPSAPYEGFDTGQVGVVITNLDTGESVEAFANSAAFYVDETTAFFRGQTIAFFDSPKGDVPAGVWWSTATFEPPSTPTGALPLSPAVSYAVTSARSWPE